MTKHYIGSKQVKLTPTTLAEYNKIRGWVLPSDEEGSTEGYLVEYLDGGKPNMVGFTGYVSWTPKQQADAAYRSVEAMTFGNALTFLKEGKKVARSGWNGSGMCVYLVPANNYPA